MLQYLTEVWAESERFKYISEKPQAFKPPSLVFPRIRVLSRSTKAKADFKEQYIHQLQAQTRAQRFSPPWVSLVFHPRSSEAPWQPRSPSRLRASSRGLTGPFPDAKRLQGYREGCFKAGKQMCNNVQLSTSDLNWSLPLLAWS